nr:DUF5682 family protein [Nocardioides zeae]
MEELQPDLVVVEGCPELDPLVAHVADPGLVPPVAALVYAADDPRRAAFYPFAAFSPEWVALRWAVARDVPVRFADLPAVHQLAPEAPDDAGEDARPASYPDVIGTLARTAGYDDPERWWEDAVELPDAAGSVLDRFALLREAVTEVRDAHRAEHPEEDLENARREAAMRRVVRAALKEGHERVAFVCGAFHAPALHLPDFPAAAHDNRLLARLPRTKVAVTWVPWTHGRLRLASGYGAGVGSPGWYDHLFTWADRDRDGVVPAWMVAVARALRTAGIDAPPASLVEATRLADELAVMRCRPSAGLAELQDAVLTVLCEGSTLPLQLVEEQVVVGQRLGEVPEHVPMAPVAADLARQQRAVRLKPSASVTEAVLDLRTPNGRARSALLHRLRLLGIDWGTPVDAGRTTGTFKEAWRLQWDPGFAVALVDAGLRGTTVADAAARTVAEDAAAAPDLPALSDLVEACLLADLPAGLTAVVDALAERTTHQHDALALAESVGPLARTRRYGDVRGADTTRVAGLLGTVVVRASVGLRAACASLDDDAAARARRAMETCDEGVTLLDDAELRRPWQEALAILAADETVHGSVGGRANRLLLDAGVVVPSTAAERMARRLSPAAPAPAAAAWLDGFLAGDAAVLLHDDDLLRILDDWMAGTADVVFDDLLPLLRRTFARFSAAERRAVARGVGRGPARPGARSVALDVEAAAPVLAGVARLLGAPGVGGAVA